MSRYRHLPDTSGKVVCVHFCPACGTTVSLSFERWTEYRAISRGTLDEPDRVSLTAHIWTRSAQSGVALPAHVECFERARTTLDGAAEPCRIFDRRVMTGRSGE